MLKWQPSLTRDELIVALNLYFELTLHKLFMIPPTDAPVVSLSEVPNGLSILVRLDQMPPASETQRGESRGGKWQPRSCVGSMGPLRALHIPPDVIRQRLGRAPFVSHSSGRGGNGSPFLRAMCRCW